MSDFDELVKNQYQKPPKQTVNNPAQRKIVEQMGGTFNPNRKLWKDILQEGMAKGAIPVPRRYTGTPEQAKWRPNFSTQTPWLFANRPQYREMYWRRNGGMNPIEYQALGLKSKEDWLRANNPEWEDAPQRELPYGAVDFDEYGNPWFGGTSHHDEFIRQRRAEIEEERQAGQTGGWKPDWHLENPERLFVEGEEGEGVDKNSLQGIYIAGKDILKNQMYGNLTELFGNVKDWAFGEIADKDADAYADLQTWYLDEVQSEYSAKFSSGDYYIGGERVPFLHILSEEGLKEAVALAEVASLKISNGMSYADIDAQVMEQRKKQMGITEPENALLRLVATGPNLNRAIAGANLDRWDSWGYVKKLFTDKSERERLYAEAHLVAEVMYGTTWDGIFDEYNAINGALHGEQYNSGAGVSFKVGEYLRYIDQHPSADPYRTARDYNNPVGEMVGRAINDPWNIITFGTTKVAKAYNTYKILKSNEVMDVFRFIDKADDLTGVNKYVQKAKTLYKKGKWASAFEEARKVNKYVDSAGNFNEFAEGVQEAQKIIEAQYQAQKTFEARPYMWWKSLISPSTSAKVMNWSADTMHAVNWVARTVARTATGEIDPDDFFELMKQVARLNSKDTAQVADALAYLGKRGNLTTLMSERGMKGVWGLGQVIDDMPSLFKSLKKGTEDLSGMELIANLVSKADDHAYRVIDKMFPTLERMVRKGEKLPFGLRAIEKVDTFWNKGPGRLMRNFFGTTQLGLNPGYAIRNMVQNVTQSIFDEGVGFLSGHTAGQAEEMFTWMGLERTAEGFLESTPFAKGSITDSLIQNYNRNVFATSGYGKRFIGIKGQDWRDVSAKVEQWSLKSIFNRAIPRAMEQMLNRNVSRNLRKLIPNIDPAIAVDIERVLVRRMGDVAGTMDEIKDWVNTGVRRVLGSEHMPKKLRTNMKQFVGDSRWAKWMDESESADDAVQKLRDWQKQSHANAAKDLEREVVIGMQDGNLDDVTDADVLGFMGDATMEGDLPFDMNQELASFINANTYVKDRLSEALLDMQRNFELGLGPKSTKRTRKIFNDAAAQVKLRLPQYFGGGEINGFQYYNQRVLGGFFRQGQIKIQERWGGLIERLEALEYGDDYLKDLEDIWNLGGLEKRFGPWDQSLSKRDVREKLVDEIFKQRQELGEQWRDANYLMGQQFIDDMSATAIDMGVKMPATNVAMSEAKKARDIAVKFDKHLPLRWVEKDLKFANKLIKSGQEARGYKEKVLAWARQYGYPTAIRSKGGGQIKLDKILVNVFNKYMKTDLEDLSDLTKFDLDELHDTLLLHSVGLAKESVESPEDFSKIIDMILRGDELPYEASMRKNFMLDILEEFDPNLRKEYGLALYNNYRAKGTPDFEETTKVLEGLTERVKEAFKSVPEVPSLDDLVGMDADALDVLLQKLIKFDPDTGKNLGRQIMNKRAWVESNAEDIEKFAISGKDAQKRAQGYVDASVQKMNDALDEAYNDLVAKMDEFRLIREEEQVQIIDDEFVENVVKKANVSRPQNVYGGETAPMGARVWQENAEGIDGMVDDLEDFIRKNWGEVQTKSFRDKQAFTKRLPEIEKHLHDMMDQARVVARDYAEMTSDFILHNYQKQKNFDLVLAYIYPYSFWYTRTYANWMQRILRNPGAVQAYYDYKRALAKKNSDLPDWMKHYWNISGLFGLDTEHPLYANMEAWINPLDKLVNPDFNDPDKRATQFGRAMDNLGKFGPSTHQLYAILYGMYRYGQGRGQEGEEGAKAREGGIKWMGRLTGNISRFARAAQDALGIEGPEGFKGGIEIDPLLITIALAEGRKWWQGMDPYEQNRAARAITGMVERGQLGEDEAVDALMEGWGNPDFEQAISYARSKRTSGDLFSYLGTPAFRTRTIEDMQADAMDTERRRIFALRSQLDEDAWAQEWEDFNKKFPHADIMSIARGNPEERDTMFTYHVLRRIPPGAKRQMYEAAGLNPDTVQDFYDTKGQNLLDMTKNQRQEFMQNMINLSMVFSTPDDATAWEWKTASNAYGFIEEQLLENYGKEIADMESTYWSLLKVDRGAAYDLLDQVPELQALMNDRTQMLNNDPLLRKYYSTFQAGKSMYNSMMYDELYAEFPNVEDEQQAFYDARARGEKVKPSDRLVAYWEKKGVLKEHYENLILSYGQFLPEGNPINFRKVQEEKLTEGGKELYAGAQEFDKQDVPEYMDYEWSDWAENMSPALQRVISDWAFRGNPLSDSAESSLEYAVGHLGVSLPMARDLIRQALLRHGAQFYSEENPPTLAQVEDTLAFPEYVEEEE